MEKEIPIVSRWGELCLDLLDEIGAALSRDHQGSQLSRLKGELDRNPPSLKSLRLVNSHWERCASGAVKCLTLSGQLPRQGMIDSIRQKFPSVDTLELHPPVTCQEISLLERIPRLTHLDVDSMNVRLITDAHLTALACLTGLRGLWLDGLCSNITPTGVSALSALTNLEALGLRHCMPIVDEGMTCLGVLTSLWQLNLEGTAMRHASFVNTFLALKDLNLRRCITNEGVTVLGSLTTLTKLNLSECPEITNGIRCLSSLTGLKDLDLRWCWEVTDDGMKGLGPLRALTTLDLSGCAKVTKYGLQHLGGLTAITKLTLDLCRITNDDMRILSGLTALRHLSVKSCERVSQDSLRTVLSSLTTLTIAGPTESGRN
ncbi:unnamed protein product [Ostreobium quekettii]|uniref:F-box/LRR-repeat protein 15-like leucin rich repeat domain-containing protein n=1 Tax=Ostreobium quekettii TaxID=121088 RepID=A0A8S1IT16_9CHLO|nr:unnamed protein product [Ostreobium quekettii]|eukprot:evm.model.scf_2595.1 EVM.evm.TU.scf_2595.1   scf_2595:3153-5896(-)